MGIASFLGNLPWEKIADIAAGAAEINRPGGSLANLERNRLAQKLMQQQMDENTMDFDNKKKRMGAMDALANMGPGPTVPRSRDFERMAPTSLDELKGAPTFSNQNAIDALNKNPLPAPELDAARMQFRKDATDFSQQREKNLLTAYPELAGQLALKSMTPEYKNVGKSLVRIDGDRAEPIFTDTTQDELTAWQKTQLEKQEADRKNAERRLDQQDRIINDQNDRANRPKNSAFIDIDTGSPLRINSDGDYILGDKVVDPTKIMSAADFGKHVMEAETNLKGVQKAERLKGVVDKNPNAFSLGTNLMQSAAGMIPSEVMADRAKAAVLTQEEQTAKAELIRDAAAAIHELYGAALSKIEAEGRSKEFLVESTDGPDRIKAKLDAAINYASNNMNTIPKAAIMRASKTTGIKLLETK